MTSQQSKPELSIGNSGAAGSRPANSVEPAVWPASTAAAEGHPPAPHRHHVSFLFVLFGFLCFIAGVYLLLADPGGWGERRIVSQGMSFGGSDAGVSSGAPRSVTFDTSAPAAATAGAATSRSVPTAMAAFPAEVLDGLTRSAESRGLPAATVQRAFANLEALPASAIRDALAPAERSQSAGDFLKFNVANQSIDQGRRLLSEHAGLLHTIERHYGVDRHILVALWGVESGYGRGLSGSHYQLATLASLAGADRPRRQFWQSEFLSALALIEAGELPSGQIVGSPIGALGPLGLLPSVIERFGVDFDGDGRRDVINSLPDAFATAANALRAAGWRDGRAWGREVTLPQDFDFALAAPSISRTPSDWQALGIRVISGLLPFDDDPVWRLVLPAGAKGPAFLVSTNFDVLLRANRAVPYALAVSHLADRLAGGRAIDANWPADDMALTADEAADLQRLLLAATFDPGPIDGIVGPLTQDAVRRYQRARGLITDGHPTHALLRQLRAERRN